MKKVLSFIAVAMVATMVSCGPSAEEKAKVEERTKFMADSATAAVQAQTEAAAAAATATADSLAKVAAEAAAATATVVETKKH